MTPAPSGALLAAVTALDMDGMFMVGSTDTCRGCATPHGRGENATCVTGYIANLLGRFHVQVECHVGMTSE